MARRRREPKQPDLLASFLAEDDLDRGLDMALPALAAGFEAEALCLFLADETDLGREFWHPRSDAVRDRYRPTFRRLAEKALAAHGAGAGHVASAASGARVQILDAGGSVAGIVVAAGGAESPAVADGDALPVWLRALGWRLRAHREIELESAKRAKYERWFRTLDEQLRVLDRERQKFAAIVHRFDAIVFVTDTARRIRWTNSAMSERRAPGLEGSSWIGLACQAVCQVHGASDGERECRDCPVRSALERNMVVHREYKTGEPGEERSLYLSALPIKGPDGRPAEVMVMIQDLSDLEDVRTSARFRRELREVEAQLHTVVGHTPVVLFQLDREGVFTLSEGRGLEVLGLEPGQVVGQSAFELYKEHPAIASAIRRALKGETFTEIVELGALAFETRYTPVHDRSGALTGVVGVATDVSERRQLEEKLRHAQRMESIGRLAGGVAHDFNNLLAAILGHTELMMGELGPKHPLRRNTEEIQKAGVRGAMLTRQLLAFGRRQVLSPASHDLNAVLAGMDELLRRLIAPHVELTLKTSAGPAYVKADRGQLEQIVMNLALNARDAMPEGGSLEIALDVRLLEEAQLREHPSAGPGPYCVLTVSDTGCGIPADTLNHVFEPFYTTKSPGSGTGLGLATVHGVAEQAGGFVQVESEAGAGTTFRVFLPVTDEVPEAAGEPVPPSPLLHGAETVLLVEDEETVRSVAREVLATHGYGVLEAANGVEALRVADSYQGPVHLLVSDVIMPEMGGGELAHKLLQKRPGMRVLFMSGYTDDAIVRSGVHERLHAFLHKPFSIEAFARKVRDVLDAPEDLLRASA